jgi:alkanesulfonate monooxygenase SsuD/methylene tetrahydromethanopterin reductase-like flavin-dependent oxidoreductase (luciferase family)
MLAMNALWRDEVAEFKGEYVSFEPSWAWPKPVQQPRIRTLIGGAPGPKMFAAIAEWADGWIPIGGAGIRDSLPVLRDAWTRHNRDGSPDIVPFGTLPSDDKLAYYRDIGCTEVVLRVPAADRDTVLQTLDSFATYVGRF